MGGRKRWAVVWFALCAGGSTVAPPAAEIALAGATDAAAPARAGLIRLRRPDGVDRAPDPLTATENGDAAAALSSDDLPEVRGHTAAGGTTVNLRGRFRTSIGARRAPGGTLAAECTVDPPVSTPAD